MAQVSRLPLEKDVEEQITKEFWWIITNLQDEKDVKKFLGDLLTKTERIMLIKRLAVALLLVKGYSYGQIRAVLKVSPTTTNQMQRWLEKGGEGYKLVIERLLKKEKMELFFKKLNNFLDQVSLPFKSDIRSRTKWGFRLGEPKEE